MMSLLVAFAAGFIVAPTLAQTPPEVQRISFQIATGPVSGSYLRVGEAIANIVSNPPGLARCETQGVCGPEGLIATSRSSSGSVANAIAVENGRVKSAIVQGDVAAAAFAGREPFKDALKDLRALARLHDETIHLVVASRSRIKRLRDLTGKRVAVDIDKAATIYTVRSVLRVAKVPLERVTLKSESPEQAADDLRNGKLDAFFVIGIAPIGVVDGLVRRGQARVIGIDAATLSAITRSNPMFAKHDLAAGTYRGSKAVSTLNVASIWVVHESLSPDVAYALLRSLWNPANRRELDRLGQFGKAIEVKRAAENLPLPLHKGAERFYAEVGR